MNVTVTEYNEIWVLDAHKVAFLPNLNLLVIADLHLGKAHHFRKEGIAVPNGVAQANLKKLQKVISDYQPKQVLFLGDLFHSKLNKVWEGVCQLIAKFSTTRFLLVEGNHDILASEQYQLAGIKTVGEVYQMNQFAFTHAPNTIAPTEGIIEVSGHIHPKVTLRGRGKQVAVLPCFYFTHQQVILPAFGEFTGGYRIQPKKGERVYSVAGNEIIY